MKVSKENNFSLLHLLGACMVVFGHMFALARCGAPAIFGEAVHVVGVYILFAVSGYLVTKSYMRTPNTGLFYLKRLLRIYPPLFVCLVLTVIGMRRVSVAGLPEYVVGAWEYVKCNLLMKPYYNLPGVFIENPYQYAVNGSLWTLPVELMCFFLLPVYLFALKFFGKHDYKVSFLWSALLVAAFLGIQAQDPKPALVIWGTDWLDSLRVIAFFFMGSSYGLMPEDTLRKTCRAEVAVALAFLTLCLGSYQPKWMLFLLLPYLVISIGLHTRGILRSFCSRHDYAYGIFLWGFPVQQLVMYGYIHLHLQFQVSPLVLFLVAAPITVFMAFMQAAFVEAPVKRFVKRITS